MLATKHIKHLNNSLRLTFGSLTRVTGSRINFPSYDVPMMDYIGRFDPARPVFCAVESIVGENIAAMLEVFHLCFDSAYGSGWSSAPGLSSSMGCTYKQVFTQPVTSDTVGLPLNGGLLLGGVWQFSFRDIFGDFLPIDQLELGYSFTLVLFQKSEV